MEYRNGHAEVRRSRRLVLSFVATVVNYEYCFYWMFYQVSLHLCQVSHAFLQQRMFLAVPCLSHVTNFSLCEQGSL